MNSFKGYMNSRILNICIQMTKVKINCHPKTPFSGHFWVYVVDFHSEDGKMAFFRYDFQIFQHFLHKKWSKCNSLEVILQSSDFLNTDVRETLLVSCNVSYTMFTRAKSSRLISCHFIPIKVLGGGQTSDYDRKLLGTLGVKKNHISNGFSGGNGAS